MIVTRKAIARRTVLRGLGATVALPLLDAMVPALTALAQTAGQTASRASASSTFRMGAVMNNWTPARSRRRLRAAARSSSRSAPFAIACSS